MFFSGRNSSTDQIVLPYRLRRRLLSSFLAIIVLLAGLNAVTLFWSGTYYIDLSGKLEQQVAIHEVSLRLRSVSEEVGSFISSSNPAYMDQIDDNFAFIENQLAGLSQQVELRSMMYYQLIDLQSMAGSLLEDIKLMGTNLTHGQPMIYIRNQEGSINRHIGYIENELAQLNSSYMDRIQNFYSGFARQMSIVVRSIIILTLTLVIISFFIARSFTLSVSRPIHALALHLISFGKGDLETVMGSTRSRDEIAVLVDSFNQMVKRIRLLILDIQQKADIEKRLKSEELANQETRRLLRESELALLQSQINPHFLFNTLNIISSLSQLENAPQTEKVISNLSNLLRCSLKNQNELVKIEREVEIIRSYMSIQQVRFGNKIVYKEAVDPSLLQDVIPSMLLQPLVENAVKHGLEPISRTGIIELQIRNVDEEHFEISIRDNGVGISEAAAAAAVTPPAEGSDQAIGLRNVARRLELRYGKKVLSIRKDSPQGTGQGTGQGTVCTITLPRDYRSVSEPEVDTDGG
jgi:two-component system, sensor histidine kinase YesM